MKLKIVVDSSAKEMDKAKKKQRMNKVNDNSDCGTPFWVI